MLLMRSSSPKNSDGNWFASLSLLTKAEKEETQFPMKMLALPISTRSSWGSAGFRRNTFTCSVKRRELEKNFTRPTKKRIQLCVLAFAKTMQRLLDHLRAITNELCVHEQWLQPFTRLLVYRLACVMYTSFCNDVQRCVNTCTVLVHTVYNVVNVPEQPFSWGKK